MPESLFDEFKARISDLQACSNLPIGKDNSFLFLDPMGADEFSFVSKLIEMPRILSMKETSEYMLV